MRLFKVSSKWSTEYVIAKTLSEAEKLYICRNKKISAVNRQIRIVENLGEVIQRTKGKP